MLAEAVRSIVLDGMVDDFGTQFEATNLFQTAAAHISLLDRNGHDNRRLDIR